MPVFGVVARQRLQEITLKLHVSPYRPYFSTLFRFLSCLLIFSSLASLLSVFFPLLVVIDFPFPSRFFGPPLFLSGGCAHVPQTTPFSLYLLCLLLDQQCQIERIPTQARLTWQPLLASSFIILRSLDLPTKLCSTITHRSMRGHLSKRRSRRLCNLVGVKHSL